MKKACFALICSVVPLLCFMKPVDAQVKNTAKPVRIRLIFEPVFKKKPVTLADRYYVSDAGDTLYFDALRFYITNIKFEGPGFEQKEQTSFLFDASDPAATSVTVDGLVNRKYQFLSFTIGVDSIVNTSGANEGDLDQAKGMYWTWNSGYIMAKLEGHSTACPTLHHAFEYHIGGFKPPYNTAREVHHLQTIFSMEIDDNQQDIEKWNSKDHMVTLKIQADLAAWFKGVDLAKTNSIVIPGKEASDMADRYARMFTVTSIHVE